uniref:Uncharacterized protein LOC117368670 n=1 Tax=Geotrypetes seraphini TaxID=260995 RepID=A0A6P8SH81_GEOSA|nr:uncharacterized protein LOC117368670 [Geotrypetes seraphini]
MAAERAAAKCARSMPTAGCKRNLRHRQKGKHSQHSFKGQPELKPFPKEDISWLISQCLTTLPRAEKIKALRKCWTLKRGLDLVKLFRRPEVLPLSCEQLQIWDDLASPGEERHFYISSKFKKKKKQKPGGRAESVCTYPQKRAWHTTSQQELTHKVPYPTIPSSIEHMKASTQNTSPRNPVNTQVEKIQVEKIHQLLPILLKKFPAGLKLPKLEDIVRREHEIDLVKISQDLGYLDTRSFLLQIANIKVSTPTQGSRTLVKYQKGAVRQFGSKVIDYGLF